MSALPSCSASKSAEKVSDKPLNIVYIMTDDHTAQMMSAYDTRNINTPNLDRIAADGVKFTNSFVANLSQAPPAHVCSPASTPTPTGSCQTRPACSTPHSPHGPAISGMPDMRLPS